MSAATKNRYVFLDIDGVMKPGRSHFRQKDPKTFDALAIAAINRLCETTGASIVFNTTWNRLNIVEIAEAQGLTAPIAGKTMYPHLSDRLTAIKHWLEENHQGASLWVSLDDFQIMHENAILVDTENGISIENCRDACRILEVPDDFVILL